jgi:hypothetical protein
MMSMLFYGINITWCWRMGNNISCTWITTRTRPGDPRNDQISWLLEANSSYYNQICLYLLACSKQKEERIISLSKFLLRFSVFILIVAQLACSSLFHTHKSYIKYPIKSGDTLYEIAKRFDVTVEEIQSVNKIRNPRALVIGTQLKIPYNGQSLQKQSSDKDVAVQIFGSRTIGSVKESKTKINIGESKKYIGELYFPVNAKGSYVSSSFGWRWFNFHEGIDIAGKVGDPIYAAHPGKIVYSGDDIRGYGNLIVLKSDTLMTVYGHNDRNRVKRGDSVKKGQRIADLGQSGKASGPHCHFEVRVRNNAGKYTAVDPLSFFKK